VKAQLAELGVEVVDRTACTIESENLYSYRREGPESGRMAGLIKLVSA
jgi:polyphenol oxidase